MPERRATASFHLVCSDEPRNGKTLYARLLADYLILCERTPLIFDAAQGASSLGSYFHVRSYKVDLSVAAGQIALFDRVLEQQAQDCVVDLPAHLLTGVARVMHDIAFADAARGHGLGVVIHFLVDRHLESLFAGRRLRATVEPDRFIIVRNEAIVPPLLEPAAQRRYDELAREGQVLIPALDPKLVERVEEETFSFGDFALRPESIAYFARGDIKAFLTRVYARFEALALASDFADLRRQRQSRESQA